MRRLTKILPIMFLFFTSVTVKSQIPDNSFRIIANSVLDQETFYRQSIASANLESYRLRDKRVKLTFKEGFEVELFSAIEMKQAGNTQYDPIQYPEDFPIDFILPIFAIHPNGMLSAEFTTHSKMK